MACLLRWWSDRHLSVFYRLFVVVCVVTTGRLVIGEGYALLALRGRIYYILLLDQQLLSCQRFINNFLLEER